MLTHVRQRLDRLASSELDPRRTAAGIALGVFLSFSPFLGLQILLGLALAFAFRLSRVAVLVGLCANLPWIMVPWYVLTTGAAAAVIGVSNATAVDLSVGLLSAPIFDFAFLERTGVVATGLFWPFLLGPTTGALVLAVVAYFISFGMLSRRNHRLAVASPNAEPSAGLPSDAE